MVSCAWFAFDSDLSDGVAIEIIPGPQASNLSPQFIGIAKKTGQSPTSSVLSQSGLPKFRNITNVSKNQFRNEPAEFDEGRAASQDVGPNRDRD